MINREFINATLLSYSREYNDYGELRDTSPIETSITVTKPKLYTHGPTDDVRFQVVTDTCLTYNKDVSDENEIKVGDVTYLISFANHEGRLSQLFLSKK